MALIQTSTSKSFHLTDVGNAQRLVHEHGQDIHWEPHWQRWFCWTGKRWEIDESGEIERRAKATIRSIYSDAARLDLQVAQSTDECSELKKKASMLRKHADKSEQKPRIDAAVALAKSEPGVHISYEELDADPMLLNTLSGTVDLRTGEVRPHQREDMLTKMICLPLEDINTPAPTWERFIREIMCGDEEMVDFLQKAAGYSLTGRLDEQCLFILFGNGSNGKSTFVETLRQLLGDYAQQADFSTFLEHEGDKVRNDIARMVGARFVAATEGPEGKRLDEAVIKHLTGADRIPARFLYREHFEFTATHKIFLSTNHKPVIKGVDEGIWRRLRLVPFAAHFSKDKKDPYLMEKLRKEFPGILAWCIRGCLAWQKDRLGMPKAVEEATKEYRNEMDTIQAFISECCVLAPGCSTQSQHLYERYRQWASANGYGVLSQTRFSMTLSDRGVSSKKTSSAKMWIGIGISAISMTGMVGMSPSKETLPNSSLMRKDTYQPTTPTTPTTNQLVLTPGEDLVFEL